MDEKIGSAIMASRSRADEEARGVERPRRRTQAERAALSDKRMFETALHLVSEHGTASTTLKEIGERSGYSRGLASSRFGSKEQFLYELVGEIRETWETEFRVPMHGRRGLDAFNANLDLTIGFLSRDDSYIRSMYLLYYETVGSNTLVRERLADAHRAHGKALIRWLREGIEDGDIKPETPVDYIATEFLALYYGLVYLWLTDATSLDFKASLSSYRNGLLDRIRMRR